MGPNDKKNAPNELMAALGEEDTLDEAFENLQVAPEANLDALLEKDGITSEMLTDTAAEDAARAAAAERELKERPTVARAQPKSRKKSKKSSSGRG